MPAAKLGAYNFTMHVPEITTISSLAIAVGTIIYYAGRLSRKVDSIGLKINQVDDGLNKRIESLDSRVEKRFDQVDKRVDALNMRIDHLYVKGIDVK